MNRKDVNKLVNAVVTFAILILVTWFVIGQFMLIVLFVQSYYN